MFSFQILPLGLNGKSSCIWGIAKRKSNVFYLNLHAHRLLLLMFVLSIGLRASKFLGLPRIFARTSPNLREKIVRLFPKTLLSQKTPFGVISKSKRSSFVLFGSGQKRSNIGRHFCTDFQGFCRIFPRFSGTFPDFHQSLHGCPPPPTPLFFLPYIWHAIQVFPCHLDYCRWKFGSTKCLATTLYNTHALQKRRILFQSL